MSWTPKPDANGRLYTHYAVIIRRVSDGAELRVEENTHWHNSSWFWWSAGNGACDCNRFLDFERAAGREADRVDIPCGDEAYKVIRFEFPDGTELAGPDA